MITKFCQTCKHHNYIVGLVRSCNAGVPLNPYIHGCTDAWEAKDKRVKEEME